MQAMFTADLAASDPIELEGWERRPLKFRLKEMMARLWARLL
jgi:broad specificity phosphatase PhoE